MGKCFLKQFGVMDSLQFSSKITTPLTSQLHWETELLVRNFSCRERSSHGHIQMDGQLSCVLSPKLHFHASSVGRDSILNPYWITQSVIVYTLQHISSMHSSLSRLSILQLSSVLLLQYQQQMLQHTLHYFCCNVTLPNMRSVCYSQIIL